MPGWPIEELGRSKSSPKFITQTISWFWCCRSPDIRSTLISWPSPERSRQ